jgi:hypothetical protein
MNMFASNVYDEDKTYEDGKQHEDDKKLLVRFEVRPYKMEKKSQEAGRPIYEDVEYISIIIPGSRDILTAPIDEQYKKRFQERYDKWKAHSDNTRVEGTPLTELTWMTKSQALELSYYNISTIEQLAGLSDADAFKFMGNHQLRQRAKNFLEAAAGEAPMLKLQAELEQRDNKIEVMERRMQEMEAAMKSMAESKKVAAKA